jgi:TolB-like protein
MAERPFPAYQGGEPYIFVSYAHGDADVVYPELKWLNDQGINVWYDEGISPGSRWSDALAKALDDSAHFVYFVTPQSVASQNCLDEVGFALECEKPLLALHVEQTKLPAGLSLRLGSRQAIMKYELTEEAYREKLRDALGEYAAAPSSAPEASLNEQATAIERTCSSMAILPLDNRSTENADLDALGEAISEDVTDAIACMGPGSRLIGGSETLRFRDQHLSPSQVAHELDVGVVLKGNIRKLGPNLRIVMELVNEEGEQVWSHRFDEQLETIFEREDHLVDLIVWGFAIALTTYLQRKTAELPAEQLGPWGLFWKAWHHYDITDRSVRAESRSWLERAIELDPLQPGFKGMLALRLANEVMQGFSNDREADTQRALELAGSAANSGVGGAMMNAGNAFGFLGDHRRAVALCRRAYEMVPRFVPSKWLYASRLMHAGIPQEALDVYAEAEAIRLPGQGQPHVAVARCHMMLGNLDEALKAAREGVDQGVDAEGPIVALTVYANALACADQIDEAAAAIAKARELVPNFTLRASINAYRRAFGTEDAREAVTKGLEKLMDLGYE